MFTNNQLEVIKYCAEECYRQRSGEHSVSWMLNAWDYAEKETQRQEMLLPSRLEDNKITLDFIIALGKLVEPEENKDGFRTHPIGITDVNAPFGVRNIGSDWHEIERHLQTLLESYYEGTLGNAKFAGIEVTAEEHFYVLYETIHPFGDGNGRTGKIILNYLNGTLNDPIWPPNFWGISNP